MKISISTLFFSIVLCLQFCELNAADRRPSSSALPSKRGGKTRGGLGRFRVQDPIPPPFQGPANVHAFYEGKQIDILTDPTGLKALRVDCPGNYIPVKNDYRYQNFLVRLTIIGGFKVVEYVNPNRSLLGVREPRPSTGNTMEPNDTTWFVVYNTRYFRVKQNCFTKKPEEISLIPENEHKPGDYFEKVTIADFEFLVFSESTGKINGAMLTLLEH